MGYNHCNCTGTSFVPVPPPCSGTCLKVVSPITSCENSPGPCGVSGSIDLDALNDLSICVGCTVTYILTGYDPEVFPTMTLDPNTGVLNWTTGDAKYAMPGMFYQVSYMVECPCMSLASQGIVTICVKDLCGNKTCPPGEVCDPCTATCVPLIDIEVS